MKIICITNNFLKGSRPIETPVFCLKPDTSVLTNNRPFFLPHFTTSVSCNISPVIRINKVGKNIPEKFAHRYYNEISVGIDFTDEIKLAECKQNNLPWDASKAFENSAPIGEFYNKEILENQAGVLISLKVNENNLQEFKIQDLAFSFDYIISYVSRYFPVKTGDFIFSGSLVPAQNVNINDRIKVLLNGSLNLDFAVK